ncbi:MAG: chloride channel protein [Bacteroidota bacterium]|nr:chloride channel protein [Bacteroidota bacterium]
MENKTKNSTNNHRLFSEESATDGIPIAPSLGPSLQTIHLPSEQRKIDKRVFLISILSIGVAIASGFVAQFLISLINFFTGIFFYHTIGFSFVSPANNSLGYGVIVIPVIGGIIVGIMARYGSQGIRGHGIPEAMENVLTNKSRIPPRLTFLKPISAAISIGTGGPFGAEGPIIATGGALGSLMGQVFKATADERKTLLAAGAAAGMAATFGSPVSAVILAIELLLFEFRPRSIIPVALGAATATGVRIALVGTDPIFGMTNLHEPGNAALILYVVLGAVVGIASVFVTRVVYLIEDVFEKLSVHWMWWPALGGIGVGVIGFFVPRTFGVGYDNIQNILSGSFGLHMLVILCAMKFLSWSVSLGSGTSGGTLAPLFTIGGALGAILGIGASVVFPSIGIDLRIAALVGMAAMFSGASRALLTSVVFAFETTLQPVGLLPLLGGCTASYFASFFLMKNTIMTEKIVRRGVKVPSEYAADFLDQLFVKDFAAKKIVTLRGDDTVLKVRTWIETETPGSTHQGFPIVDEQHHLIGVLTRRDIFEKSILETCTVRSLIKRPPAAVYEDCSLREAADHMVKHNVGRLPVIARTRPSHVIGIITRSDLLSAHQRRLAEASTSEPGKLSKFLLKFNQ